MDRVESPGSSNKLSELAALQSWPRNTPAPRALLERYMPIGVLGEGGTAVVWHVVDSVLQVERAIKIMLPAYSASEALRLRFLDEARTMARLQDPGIVRVFDFGASKDGVFLVMEYVPGGSLERCLQRLGPLPPWSVSSVIQEVLRALGVAHGAGVVHRDIKPDNILLDARDQPKISDFGIAQLEKGSLSFTRTGASMGTLAYMPPEQQDSAKGVDARADLYAVGATIYALCTGLEPMHLYVNAAREKMLDRLPKPLRPVVDRACRFEASERYDSAKEMLQCLRRGHLLLQAPLSFEPLATKATPPRDWSEVLSVSNSHRSSPGIEDPQIRNEEAQAQEEARPVANPNQTWIGGLDIEERPRPRRSPGLAPGLGFLAVLAGVWFAWPGPEQVSKDEASSESSESAPAEKETNEAAPSNPAWVSTEESKPVQAEASEIVELEEQPSPPVEAAPARVAPAPVSLVPVFVNTVPWREIKVDGGRKVGSGTEIKLKPGSHRLEALSAEGETVKWTIRVSSSGENRYCWDLEKEISCRR